MPRWIAAVSCALALAGCSETPEVGAFSAIWSVTRSGAIVSCEQMAVSSVEVSAVAPDQTGYSTRFPCELREGLTSYMPPDDYQVTLRLLDRDLAPIASAPTLDVELFPGRIVDLASVGFDLP